MRSAHHVQHYPNAEDATVGRHLFVRSLKGSRKKRPENVRIHTLDELHEQAFTVPRAARFSSSMTSPMLPTETAPYPGSDATYTVFVHLNAEKAPLYRERHLAIQHFVV